MEAQVESPFRFLIVFNRIDLLCPEISKLKVPIESKGLLQLPLIQSRLPLRMLYPTKT